MITTDEAVKKLVCVAEAVALEACVAVVAGEDPCPLQSDDEEQWCLPCLAKKAIEQFMNA